MFDDPGKALRRMEEELRAAEYEEEIDEEEALLAEAKALIGDEDIPIRPKKDRKVPTRAEGFGRTVYADEAFDESAAVTVSREKTKKQKKRKKKGIGDLVFLAILEVIGILAIAGWWLQWMI